MDAGSSRVFPQRRENMLSAFKILKIDTAEMILTGEINILKTKNKNQSSNPNQPEESTEHRAGNTFSYSRDGFENPNDICEECLMKLELPLLSSDKNLGTLNLIKNLKKDPISYYTLRRIEHLRRTIIPTIEKLSTKPNP